MATDGPNSVRTAASARPAGEMTSRQTASTSMTTAPRRASIAATVDFPDPMPPVSPTISTLEP